MPRSRTLIGYRSSRDSFSSPVGPDQPVSERVCWTYRVATLPSADHAAEIARLQQENERLRMERDILKKSIAIFAGVRT